MKNQPNSQFYFNRANVKPKPAIRPSYVPPVEDGEVHDLDTQKGIGHIQVTNKDGSTELVRFYYSVGICRAVVKDGRVTFEYDENGREPHVGVKVKLIVGYLPGKDIPFTFHWCTVQSWARAEEELKANPAPVKVAVPVKPHSHGGERKARRCPKVVPFPTGESVTTSSEPQAVAN